MILETEVRDGVAFLRIQDAERRNALSTPLLDQITTQAARTDVAAFVLTGSHGFFSAGADVDELASGNWTRPEENGPPLLFRRITEDPRPWVAAVNGPAIGGGCELALSCDAVLVAESAWLLLPEASLGVVPNTAVRLLHGRLGHAAAMETLLGRARLAPDRAVDLGLATATVPDGELDETAERFVRRLLASVSPTAFHLVKAALRRDDAPTWPEVATLLSRTDPDDMRTGIAAMRERTRTDYTRRWTTTPETEGHHG